jgi:hypothetical protein
MALLRQRGDHPLAFVAHRARRIAALAAHSRRNLDQLERQPVRQALAIILEAGRDPGRRAFADRDEARLHTMLPAAHLPMAMAAVFTRLPAAAARRCAGR